MSSLQVPRDHSLTGPPGQGLPTVAEASAPRSPVPGRSVPAVDCRGSRTAQDPRRGSPGLEARISEPERNIWCRHYVRCLDRAVMEDSNFDCAGCRFKFDDSGKTVAFDFIHDFLFVAAVFFPRVYAVFQQIRKKGSSSSIDWKVAEKEIVGRVIRKDVAFFTKAFQDTEATMSPDDESEDEDLDPNLGEW